MNTMLIKIFNLFLLLASAMTVAHAEYVYAGVKSDKHNITQHTTLDRQGLNYHQTLLQADVENETSDLDSLTTTPELPPWHRLSFGQPSALSLANVAFKFSFPQSRAPPVIC